MCIRLISPCNEHIGKPKPILEKVWFTGVYTFFLILAIEKKQQTNVICGYSLEPQPKFGAEIRKISLILQLIHAISSSMK